MFRKWLWVNFKHLLTFQKSWGHLWITAFIPLPKEQVMHLIKLDTPYSCTSIVALLWASIAICKNSRKSKNLCMAWKHDCGLRSGTFLAFVQSTVIYYTSQHFSKLRKNTFPTVTKAAKSNQISQITERQFSIQYIGMCSPIMRKKMFSCDTGNLFYIPNKVARLFFFSLSLFPLCWFFLSNQRDSIN